MHLPALALNRPLYYTLLCPLHTKGTTFSNLRHDFSSPLIYHAAIPQTTLGIGVAVVIAVVVAFIVCVLAGVLLFYYISKAQSQCFKLETFSNQQQLERFIKNPC